MGEIFIMGDPRFLSGGSTRCEYLSYEQAPPTVESLGKGTVTTESVLAPELDGLSLKKRVERLGQRVHCGKSRYHQCEDRRNVFLRSGEFPTVGVELETEAKSKTEESYDAIQSDLVSNWFHMERDGSLDPENNGKYGFEIITEPLPPRVYRNKETWAGLQNALVPWLSSYGFPRCGLHVHVGLEQFETCDRLPMNGARDRRKIGKFLSAFVYYCVLDPSFVDRVVLRKNGDWSSAVMQADGFLSHASDVSSGKMTAAEAVDIVVGEISSLNWSQIADYAVSTVVDGNQFCVLNGEIRGFSGHGVEINCEHPYTVEFRRGKGTVNSISIHRTVELMSLIVRYAYKMANNPEMTVTSKDMYRFIAENTTSLALKAMAEKEA